MQRKRDALFRTLVCVLIPDLSQPAAANKRKTLFRQNHPVVNWGLWQTCAPVVCNSRLVVAHRLSSLSPFEVRTSRFRNSNTGTILLIVHSAINSCRSLLQFESVQAECVARCRDNVDGKQRLGRIIRIVTKTIVSMASVRPPARLFPP